MTKRTFRAKLEGRELQVFCIFSIVLLFVAAGIGYFVPSQPGQAPESLPSVLKGLWTIVVSRDALITDYFELAGYSAAFLNAALVALIGFVLLIREKMQFTGLTMAAFFIYVGYALWGKNPVNVFPIFFGAYLYARAHRSRLSRYLYTAMFGTCLAPLVTELDYLLPFDGLISLLLAVGMGILIGFVLPSLSMHTASMHKGYNLFNVGFSAGILAFVVVCVLSAFGLESESVMIWRYENPVWIVAGLYGYFLIACVYGLYISGGDWRGLLRICRHPGRAVTDFVMLEGVGSTLVNMGLVGILCTSYICLIGGDFSGPVVGAILTAFGFAAFGAHVRNYLPVMLGVFLSTFLTRFEPTTPGMQLAAVFAVGLAPVAGRFGPLAGLLAGMLHAAIGMCTARMCGGLNLYNNGFSAGWVAIIMIPGLESFVTGFENRKRRGRPPQSGQEAQNDS